MFNSPKLYVSAVRHWKGLPRVKNFIMDSNERLIRTRTLNDPSKIFEHNAWDDVEWDETQENEARVKVTNNSQLRMRDDIREDLEQKADEYWDKFYTIHQNRFFKDRHWLFHEFPELLGNEKLQIKDSNPETSCVHKDTDSSHSNAHKTNGDCLKSETSCANKAIDSVLSEENLGTSDSCDSNQIVKGEGQAEVNQTQGHEAYQVVSSLETRKTSKTGVEGTNLNKVTSHNTSSLSQIHGDKTDQTLVEQQKSSQYDSVTNHAVETARTSEYSEKASTETVADGHSSSFPGQHADFRIWEVGCGVGNTVFPVLQTNNDTGVFVYCCDLSPTAIDLVKEHHLYDTNRCHGFVCDVTNDKEVLPFPPGSLDVVICIFVMSAIHPDKMQSTFDRFAHCLKPGGRLLFRDYGRYDLAQLRFKKGQCLSDNFYARQDGTRVYFFTQEEIKSMLEEAGLEEEQNMIDRRLQVNRRTQQKMYRVWLQCKYKKPSNVK